MHHIQDGLNGIWLLVVLNWDRILWLGAIAAGLGAGLIAGTVITAL